MGDHKADTDENTTCKGYCPQCGADRVADIVGSRTHKEHWIEDKLGTMSATETYRILQCCGCEKLYVQREQWLSGYEDGPYQEIDPVTGKEILVYKPWVTYWPSPEKREKPDWMSKLDNGMPRGLLDEVYGALNADHRVLAAIGIRTVLDHMMVWKGVDAALPFEKKLDAFQEKGFLTKNDKQILSKLIDAGSAAAHRDWKPEQEGLSRLFDGMENFLERALRIENEVDEIEVPPKPERPKKGKTDSGS